MHHHRPLLAQLPVHVPVDGPQQDKWASKCKCPVGQIAKPGPGACGTAADVDGNGPHIPGDRNETPCNSRPQGLHRAEHPKRSSVWSLHRRQCTVKRALMCFKAYNVPAAHTEDLMGLTLTPESLHGPPPAFKKHATTFSTGSPSAVCLLTPTGEFTQKGSLGRGGGGFHKRGLRSIPPPFPVGGSTDRGRRTVPNGGSKGASVIPQSGTEQNTSESAVSSNRPLPPPPARPPAAERPLPLNQSRVRETSRRVADAAGHFHEGKPPAALAPRPAPLRRTRRFY